MRGAAGRGARCADQGSSCEVTRSAGIGRPADKRAYPTRFPADTIGLRRGAQHLSIDEDAEASADAAGFLSELREAREGRSVYSDDQFKRIMASFQHKAGFDEQNFRRSLDRCAWLSVYRFAKSMCPEIEARPSRASNQYQCRFSGRIGIEIIRWLYYQAPVALDRKMEKAQEIIAGPTSVRVDG